MKVQDLIKQLLQECGDRNPADVDVVLVQYNHGSDWPDETVPAVDSYGGNDHPFVVVVK